ncbi:MAG: hypothetical protein ACOX8K_08855 [Lachnospiraceae bacterium]|jgi:predicted DNA-binding protein
MGKNLENQYAFRCDKETIKKLEFIADQHTRTRNQEMKHIIKKYIDEYEKEHGEITISDEAKENPLKKQFKKEMKTVNAMKDGKMGRKEGLKESFQNGLDVFK